MLRNRPAAALVALLALACSPDGRGAAPDPADGRGEIGREEAVERARGHVDFEVRSVEVETTNEAGRPVWRITFRGRPPGKGSAVGEVVIVVLDRRTGELISLAQS